MIVQRLLPSDYENHIKREQLSPHELNRHDVNDSGDATEFRENDTSEAIEFSETDVYKSEAIEVIENDIIKSENDINDPEPIGFGEGTEFESLSTDITKGCPYCGTIIKSRMWLKLHLRVHTGERPYKCDKCPKAFKTPSARSRHRYVHSETMEFQCELCNREFKSPQGYNRHRKLHEDKKKFSCDKCDFKSFFKEAIQKHMFSHTEITTEKCILCGKMFKSRIALCQHMMVHKKADIPCELCSKRFRAPRFLKIHMQKVHGEKSLECQKCDFKTNSMLRFEIHAKVHTKVTRVETLKCNQCSYTTLKRVLLRHHTKKHNDVFYKNCGLCEYKTKYDRYLKQHLTSAHGGIKTIKCLDCKEMFLMQAELKVHKKRVHDVSQYRCNKCCKFFRTNSYLKRHLSTCKELDFVSVDRDSHTVKVDIGDEMVVKTEIVEYWEDDSDQINIEAADVDDERNVDRKAVETFYIKQEDDLIES